ncbi:tripartite tricarboxylate transporter TctB family protein [Mameliella sediminis]|uniref:tripartite tricarboxylate transporter TctB family protein n=1 Tax=Mameliella sediminis TaxID=2836866 RepID=UPI001C476EB4|nr:tripartite tricarboxylate transporter TctB family protein [Mameliella sediminis]MBY6116140.1 tripartite tricarboxylate transporter TctB family protein [Antarctobacter heliothermus]MBY6146105.1 tripartite tricarboxylate transporter TctB family protein [Mameliella alba]MBV7396902.1 tripartite tricarboxylate transporter TctB family protein [Mameliella sediminis]MBY6161810.1 tripartite tricarboxylate transporter TctB family protein [Mameliella alba]MBY6170280.1 tripartite tricarboxylate transpo
MLLNRQLVFLYVTLAVSIGYLVSALSLGAPVVDDGLTPAFFPMLVGCAAILFCSILILQKARDLRDDPPNKAPRTFTHLWVVVAIFFYIVAFKPLGYFLSSGLFVFALIVLFSSFEKLVIKAVIAAVVTGVAYLMFQQLFGVRLPMLWV